MTDVLDAEVSRALADLDARPDPARRDALLVRLLARQAAEVPPYGRFLAARGIDDPGAVDHPDGLPGLPTDAFRFARIARHAPSEDVRVFRTSGTSGGPRGAHPFRDLSFYEDAAYRAGRRFLFPEADRRHRMVLLTPDENAAPDSSLTFMLARFVTWFGDGPGTWVVRHDGLDLDALRGAVAAGSTPVAVLGTSFSYVHMEDALGHERLPLPAASRAMVTGGYKGRSRTLDPGELRRRIAERFAVPEGRVVTEYGMTELSSQMYDGPPDVAEPTQPSRWGLRAPPWVRVTAVDPETLVPVPDGTVGLLRIDDLANVGSVAAIQTSDQGRVFPDGRFEVLGRDPDAVPRGCALALDEALTR